VLRARRARRFAIGIGVIASMHYAAAASAAPPAKVPPVTLPTQAAAHAPTPKPRPNGFHLIDATITDIQSAIRRHEITCVDLVGLYLDR
jgi:hypothetical protein